MYSVYVGDWAYSSWSLRGWLLLDAFGLPFEAKLTRLYDPEIAELKRAHAPARTVPLIAWEEAGGARTVWDSLAMAETLAERHPEAGIWPADPVARADARILAAEMHAGFTALRREAPMNLHRGGRALSAPSDAFAADVARVDELWSWALARHGGPWLGGATFSAADVFYAPVAHRLDGYGVAPASEAGRAYLARLLDHPSMRRWAGLAKADPRRIALYEDVT